MHIDAISSMETILHLSFHQFMLQILLPATTAGFIFLSATAYVQSKNLCSHFKNGP